MLGEAEVAGRSSFDGASVRIEIVLPRARQFGGRVITRVTTFFHFLTLRGLGILKACNRELRPGAQAGWPHWLFLGCQPWSSLPYFTGWARGSWIQAVLGGEPFTGCSFCRSHACWVPRFLAPLLMSALCPYKASNNDCGSVLLKHRPGSGLPRFLGLCMEAAGGTRSRWPHLGSLCGKRNRGNLGTSRRY